ncbi:MAG: hypothetical protein Q7S33_05005 [Nanoarchaeota archaeon]|nr:hypothetical protein [Nanoarchaeota archaeon]
MARIADFNDPEYDRKLAEYKALKARARNNAQEQPRQESSNTRNRNY